MRVYPTRDARRVAFASVGHFRQSGFNWAAHAELKVAFPLSMLLLLLRWSAAG
jgi:hypothetical protein